MIPALLRRPQLDYIIASKVANKISLNSKARYRSVKILELWLGCSIYF